MVTSFPHLVVQKRSVSRDGPKNRTNFLPHFPTTAPRAREAGQHFGKPGLDPAEGLAPWSPESQRGSPTPGMSPNQTWIPGSQPSQELFNKCLNPCTEGLGTQGREKRMTSCEGHHWAEEFKSCTRPSQGPREDPKLR